MITSEQVDKIFPALIKAQSEMGSAKKTTTNPFFKSKYADLSELIEVSKDVLTANGLGIIQSPGGDGVKITVTARIIHVSGQWVQDTITLTATKNDPQQAGSAITYARRYQLAALFNIAQEDDDGNKASENQELKQTSEFVELKSALIDYINMGMFKDVPYVNQCIANKEIQKMRDALAVAKEREKEKEKKNV